MADALANGFSGYITTPIIEKDLNIELSKYFSPISNKNENFEYYIHNVHLSSEELASLKYVFKNTIIPIWKDLQEILSMEKLNIFTKEIENIEWKDLKEFNKKMKMAIKSFDFENIQKLISNFKVYIQILDI